jgi:hypothetical protein
MHTVTLELLRHGPPHNQLLSPLTPYLALCGNHAAVTLNLEFEHLDVLQRLSALSYEINEAQRQFQLRNSAIELGKLLSRVPGLLAELGAAADRGPGVQHLRLVLSASELALLPFELALAGSGFPGDGQHLALQSRLPLCVTREVRRVREPGLRWGHAEPRVLFACASPHGLPAVPLESHLLALRRAVSPWVGYFETGDVEERRRQVARRLHVLPRATLHDIEQHCATGEFTHVHILAHGVLAPGQLHSQFALALHDAANPDGAPDLVTGERLASALRPLQQPPRNALLRPHVVTLAACNSGQVASVLGAGGASVAHALHEAGIPLVVAGQFPLSFAGSVRLVEIMQGGLLWGVDPRELLTDLRRRLHSMGVENHDWASIVAYAALPDDFDEQVAELRVRAAKRAIDNAMDFADRVAKPSDDGSSAEDRTLMLKRAQQKIDPAFSRLADLLPMSSDLQRHNVMGLLASADKRHAEVKFWTTKLESLDAAERDAAHADSVQLLRSARARYWQCFRQRPGISWATVQYIALTLLLQKSAPPEPAQARDDGAPESTAEQLNELVSTAWTLSTHDLDAQDERSSWALGNLIELALLSRVRGSDLNQVRPRATPQKVRELVERLLGSRLTDPFQIYSTRRQLRRYVDWFPEVNKAFEPAGQLARTLLEQLRAEGMLPTQRRP